MHESKHKTDAKHLKMKSNGNTVRLKLVDSISIQAFQLLMAKLELHDFVKELDIERRQLVSQRLIFSAKCFEFALHLGWHFRGRVSQRLTKLRHHFGQLLGGARQLLDLARLLIQLGLLVDNMDILNE